MGTIGKKIKHLRKKGNVTQEQLAKSVNASREALAKWETDQATPTADLIKALAAYFGVTTDYLLGHEVQEAKQTYVIKETKFPNLERDYPNVDIDGYIKEIREAVYMAVDAGKLTPESAESLVKETTNYLMFQIEQIKNRK